MWKSLSAYARQFLELMQKPDVDQIEGLSPAISIEQKTTSRNPRSTVGTVTEIYDYMRLLWARVGVPYSPATGLPIESQTVTQMVDRTHGVAGRHAALPARPDRPRTERASTARNSPSCRRTASSASRSTAASTKSQTRQSSTRNSSTTSTWWSTVSWCAPDMAQRLAECFETALNLADGLAIAEFADKPLPASKPGESANKSKNDTHERIMFSERFACPVSGFSIEEIEPRLFSFNNPFGACPSCDGLGSN